MALYHQVSVFGAKLHQLPARGTSNFIVDFRNQRIVKNAQRSEFHRERQKRFTKVPDRMQSSDTYSDWYPQIAKLTLIWSTPITSIFELMLYIKLVSNISKA